MTNLKITERQNGLITILDLDGKIKLGEGSAELHKELGLLVEKGEKNILLNLANVSHIDSSGLGELVTGYNTLQKTGGELKLFNLSDKVHGLMTVTRLLTVFDIYENEAEAVDSFTNKSSKPAYASSLL
ncbi:MAG TPA: STAS domain-containing protein [Pyrinomonadaceae bacterium]|nr:STAS domain-containing protein [Pyrinomonadaceae bacterium]